MDTLISKARALLDDLIASYEDEGLSADEATVRVHNELMDDIELTVVAISLAAERIGRSLA